MLVPKLLAFIAAIVLGLSISAYAASRSHANNAISSGTYGMQGANSARSNVGSYGGWSLDPHTRALQELADKYRPGW